MDRRITSALAAFLACLAGAALAVDVTTNDNWQSTIQSATGTTTVNMAAGTYAATNTILVPANTSVIGTDRTAILDGGGTCRVVIATGPNVKLQGLTIQRGSSTGGGGGVKGFAATSFVYVVDCLIQSNAATYAVANQAGGGALWAMLDSCDVIGNHGEICGGFGMGTATNCTIKNNWATGYGTVGSGGSFINSGESSLSGCTFVSNRSLASSGTGAIYGKWFLQNVVACSNRGSRTIGTTSYGQSNVFCHNSNSMMVAEGDFLTNCVFDLNVCNSVVSAGKYVGCVFRTNYNVVCSSYGTIFEQCVMQGNVGAADPGCTAGGFYDSCVFVSNRNANGTYFQGPYLAEALRNCTIIGHTNAATKTAIHTRYATSVVANCIVYSNANNLITNSTDANWTNDPLFQAGTYIPTSTDVVDKANSTYTLTLSDVYGNPRQVPNGSPDIGAVENQQAVTTTARKRHLWNLLGGN